MVARLGLVSGGRRELAWGVRPGSGPTGMGTWWE